MSDTYTLNYGFTKPQSGGSDNTWGSKLNANLDQLDSLMYSLQTQMDAISGGIPDGSVTTPKLVDGAVTSIKLETSINLPGAPTAATAVPGTNTTQLATTGFVQAALAGVGVSDGDKGDIEVSAGGTNWQLKPGVIVTADLDASVLSPYALKTGAAFTGAISATQVTANAGVLMVDRTGDGVASTIINRNDVGQNRDFSWQTGTSPRFALRANNVAEGGSNAGSNMQCLAFDDTGALIGIVYEITRATRVVDFKVSPTSLTPTAGDNTTKLSTTAFVTAALSTGLATKADTVHTHIIADVTGLQAALDGKASLVHTHTTADVTGLDAALAAKADDTDLANYAPLAGANFTAACSIAGNLSLTGAASNRQINIDTSAGQNRRVNFKSGGVDRWTLGTTNLPESGSSVGSNFELIAYDDAGVSLGQVFNIPRATRVVAFQVNPTSITPAANDNSTALATTAFVQGELAAKETVGKRVGLNTQTASYTFVLADAGKLVEYNSASAGNLTVPPNSSVAFPLNTWIDVSQYGAGQVTIVAGAGVTLRSAGGALKSRAQYSGLSLVQRATDEWYVFGDITT